MGDSDPAMIQGCSGSTAAKTFTECHEQCQHGQHGWKHPCRRQWTECFIFGTSNSLHHSGWRSAGHSSRRRSGFGCAAERPLRPRFHSFVQCFWQLLNQCSSALLRGKIELESIRWHKDGLAAGISPLQWEIPEDIVILFSPRSPDLAGIGTGTSFDTLHSGTQAVNEIWFHDLYPIGSMYGIYANIGGILMVNVTIYIHI